MMLRQHPNTSNEGAPWVGELGFLSARGNISGRLLVRILLALLVLFFFALQGPVWGFANAEEDLSYSIGVTAARAVPVQQRTNISIGAFEQGLKDGQANTQQKYSDKDISSFTSRYSTEANAAARASLLSHNEELLSYMRGVSIAKAMRSQKIALDTAMVARGFSDVLKGLPTAITEAQIRSALTSNAQKIFPHMDSALK